VVVVVKQVTACCDLFDHQHHHVHSHAQLLVLLTTCGMHMYAICRIKLLPAVKIASLLSPFKNGTQTRGPIADCPAALLLLL
jgi:hypothetical protein